MLTVRVNGVEAYAATADLSQAGQRALEHAEPWPGRLPGIACWTCAGNPCPAPATTTSRPTSTSPCPAWPTALACSPRNQPAYPDSRLVDWQASLGLSLVEQTYLNSAGAELRHAQRFRSRAGVTASNGQDSQSRSLGRDNFGQQGG